MRLKAPSVRVIAEPVRDVARREIARPGSRDGTRPDVGLPRRAAPERRPAPVAR